MLRKTLEIHRQFPELLLVIMGICVGLVFISPTVSFWLVIPTLLIFFDYCIGEHQGTETSRSRTLVAFYFFVAFHGVVLSWFLDSNISGLIGASKSLGTFAATFSWVVMSLVLTLAMLPLVYGFEFVRTRKLSWTSIGMVSAIWVVCEWLRSILFSVFLIGPGGSIGDFWNFGSLGLAAIESPIAPISRVVGLYGLTLITVFGTLGLYKTIKDRSRETTVVFILLVACVFSLRVASLANNGPLPSPISGSVLQNEHSLPDFNQNTPIIGYTEFKKDIIVLPEYSQVFKNENLHFADDFVTNRLNESGVSIDVDSGAKSTRFGTLEFRNGKGDITDQQTKELLIPTGEYLPYVVIAFYKLTGQQHIVERFDENRAVNKGEPVRTHESGGVIYGPIACSGILDRNAHRTLAKNGANVFTNSASLIDFGYSKSYLNESLQMAKFHAVANSKPLIQASLGAPAFVLDANGSFVVKPDGNSTKMVDFTVQPNNTKTFYTKYGEWVLLLCLLYVGTLILTTRLARTDLNHNLDTKNC